jgi:hypothetical protein
MEYSSDYPNYRYPPVLDIMLLRRKRDLAARTKSKAGKQNLITQFFKQ